MASAQLRTAVAEFPSADVSRGTDVLIMRDANALLRPVLAHVREEYEEMPGLCLTRSQAQRLWALDQGTCEHVFMTLVDAGFLRPSAQGFVRAEPY